MIPRKTHIPHIPAFVYKFVFKTIVYSSWIIFMALFSAQFSALHYSIFSVYTNLNFNRTFQIFLQIFNKEYHNRTFLQQFFNTCYLFFEEMEPMFVIYNISIATYDDITQFGDDVNIYPVYLSRAIIIWGIVLIG